MRCTAQKRVTWAFIPGAETHGGLYDVQPRVSSESVNGDVVAYGYDEDGKRVQAGAESLVWDAVTGLLSEVSVGEVVTTYERDGFGEVVEAVCHSSGYLIAPSSAQRIALQLA